MTFQIRDRFVLSGEEYLVIGQQGQVPNPSTLGVRRSRRSSSACIRGWHAVWMSDGEGVVLHDLFVYHDGDPPEIRGVAAAPDEGAHCVYRGVDVPCEGDVRFVLGRGYAEGDFKLNGGRSPCIFATVVEIAFQRGKRVLVRNHSAAVQAIRDRIDALKALEIPPGWGPGSRKALAELEWSFTTDTETLRT